MSDILEAIQKKGIWSQWYLRCNILWLWGYGSITEAGDRQVFPEALMEMTLCDIMNDILISVLLWCSDMFLRVADYLGFSVGQRHHTQQLSKIVPSRGCYTTNHMHKPCTQLEGRTRICFWGRSVLERI